ncbi:MAG: DUF928 domain-containing protein [Chromatiales bacterium]|nr:DUF928 domain-containing protein [Chromatiales bacterium]
MKRFHILIAALATFLGLLPVGVPAGDSVGGYVPPFRGAPSVRVSGGSRGISQTGVLDLVAPDHLSLSASDQPHLYWYLSDDLPYPVILAIIDPNAVDPVFEGTIAESAERGIQGVDLSELNVKLRPGVDYQWSVSVVEDASQRSKDRFASAQIRYQPHAGKISGNALQRSRAWAADGYWYDAVAAVSDKPDAAQRVQRAALAEQVGLDQIAAFDRR